MEWFATRMAVNLVTFVVPPGNEFDWRVTDGDSRLKRRNPWFTVVRKVNALFGCGRVHKVTGEAPARAKA